MVILQDHEASEGEKIRKRKRSLKLANIYTWKTCILLSSYYVGCCVALRWRRRKLEANFWELVSICRGGTRVSHLMFTDDLLCCCKAKKSQDQPCGGFGEVRIMIFSILKILDRRSKSMLYTSLIQGNSRERGLLLSWKNDYKEVVCETDSIEVFLSSQRHNNHDAVLNVDLIEKIHNSLGWIWWINVRLIQRNTNKRENSMVKLAARLSLSHTEWFQPQSDVVPVLR
ncbi:hypothetical protein PIB30_062292 [Stylosanthes scabra]|uniref:RNase H type-1 domain-containing protein n=1 Tax=Stylosanthes scabra TaxID=79078 RepID=A0ABU6UP23_9FABA|nr:hypothetical protein [Stylosanthes scabra]